MRTLTQQFADFGARLSIADVPAETLHYAKLLTLDLLGVAIGGLETEEATVAMRACRALSNKGGNSSLWRTGVKSSPAMAAMFNGTVAHALELDDFHGIDHSGAVIVPALMACADDHPEHTGEDFLLGMVFGYEVGRRILDGAGGYRAHNKEGWHTTGTLGGFAAAAAVGKFLRLPTDELAHALGIAGSYTGGTWAFNVDGAMSKRYHCGISSQCGLQAAYLARAGMSGPASVLEADRGGYFNLYADGMTAAACSSADDLGSDFRIQWAGVKAYACCRGIHSALDVVLGLRDEGLTAASIDQIDVVCTAVQAAQLGRHDPATRLEAQFSLPYSVAVALLHGEAGYDLFTEQWLGNNDIATLDAKIVLRVDESRSIESEPTVTVTTHNGRSTTRQVAKALGDPSNPVPEPAVIAKYAGLAGRQISEDDISALRDAVMTLQVDGQLSVVRTLLEG
ncbi:MAG: MmgE/PrpD family protein [Chromatiales bacterium]|jgi:2-methylcitrate dehydratase PrpD|nr:MmgE/PrpD family protein [Chromatiales bacterium]